MQRDRKPLGNHLWAICGLAFVILGLLCCSDQQAQGRGRSGGNQQVMKMMQAQAQMNVQITAAQQKKDQETMARFDLNKNGKIDASEKPAWDKFWREVRTGKAEHPYASLDLTSKSSASTGNKNKMK
jgi:hypothetical protein